MFKKIYRYVRIAIASFFYGLKSGNKLLLNSGSDELDGNDIGGIEQQQEEQNVYKDLLKGEVTEAVRELRHEMYYSERKSYEYTYNGDGTVKKNKLFNYSGNVDRSDGYNIIVVQENKEEVQGITAMSETENDSVVLKDDYTKNQTRYTKNYRIKIKRNNFIPRFPLEKYTSKIVVKRVNNEKVMFDLYVTKYIDKFEPTTKLLHSEMEHIYMGETKTDTLQFDELSFTSFKAFGAPDLKEFIFKNIEYNNIVDFDGYYVLKFYATMETNDLIEEFYNEATAEKCRNHEMREGYILSYEDVVRDLEKTKGGN